jgi:trehalose-6-phosphate synthase
VTALTPVVERVGGSWVGWDEDAQGVPARVDGLNCDLHAVELEPELVEGYYHGFTNRTLWPLFHDLVVQPVIDRSWWRSYETVTRRFADAVSEVITASPRRPTVWIQDYHLLLLPQLLRDRFPDLRIGMFLHIPFPAPELFARLPWRESLLGGMLAADSLGFHTAQYRDNFLRTVQRVLPDATVLGDSVLREDGRRVRALSHPISIDTQDFSDLAGARRRRSRSLRCASSSAAGRCCSASTASTTRRASGIVSRPSSCCSSSDRTCEAASCSSRSRCHHATTSRSTAAPHAGRDRGRPHQRTFHRAGPRRAGALPPPLDRPQPPRRVLPDR